MDGDKQLQQSTRCPLSGGECTGPSALGCRFWRTVMTHAQSKLVVGVMTTTTRQMCLFDRILEATEEDADKRMQPVIQMLMAIANQVGIKVQVIGGGSGNGHSG